MNFSRPLTGRHERSYGCGSPRIPAIQNACRELVTVIHRDPTTGQPVVVAVATQHGGELRILNSSGEPVVVLGANDEGCGQVLVRNADGRNRAALFGDPDGGKLDLADDDGSCELKANAFAA